MTREVDLIEEVARIHGLDKLPTTLPSRSSAVGRLTPGQRLRRRLEDVLRDRGLYETVSYSLVAPGTLSRLRLEDAAELRAHQSAERGAERDPPDAAPGPAGRRAPTTPRTAATR